MRATRPVSVELPKYQVDAPASVKPSRLAASWLSCSSRLMPVLAGAVPFSSGCVHQKPLSGTGASEGADASISANAVRCGAVPEPA